MNHLGFKLVAIDLDGTLLDHNKKIPRSTVETIKKIEENGVAVVLASARPVCSMLPYVKQLNLKMPMVSLSGAYIVMPDQSEIIYERPLEFTSYQKLANIIENKKCYLKVYGKNHLYVERAIEETFKYSEGFFVPYTEVGAGGLSKMEKVPFRMFVHGLSSQVLQELRLVIQEGFPMFTTVKEATNGLEVVDFMVNKGNALQILCEKYSIDMADVIAIGNEGNDISMVKEAGLGVAMGNACDELKQLADEITKDNTALGVEWVLKKYLLED